MLIPAVTLLAAIVVVVAWIESMPNRTGGLEEFTSPAGDVRLSLTERLERHVRALSEEIGPRATHGIDADGSALARAATHIRETWRGIGFEVESQPFEVRGVATENLSVTIPGDDPSAARLVIGAHYDSHGASRTPGADDNASGVAILLELSRRMRARANSTDALARTIQFVAFTNVEPPHFHGPDMGSYRFARDLANRGVDVELMLSLECLGYYSDDAGSQQYPSVLRTVFPSRGNYVAIVGRVQGRDAIARVGEEFAEHVELPFETAALPAFLAGVDWSDHWSFWEHGYEAVMLTDTAIFRNPHYHRTTDTADTLDYTTMAVLTEGLEKVVERWASVE